MSVDSIADVRNDSPPKPDWSRIHAALVRYLRARGARADLIEDFAQETLARLIMVSREKAIVSVFALGFRIADNLIVDQHRFESRLVDAPDADWHCEKPSIDRVLDSRRAVDVFQQCLNQMPPLRREVLIRRRIRLESYRTIASDLCMNAKAVEKHITRGLLDLRRALKKAGIEPADWNR
ncbi:MAG: RNA polymerase sigma factor [Alphaproteobacteria bacterium]|nr:RNA polymerase sigma factor [Alphaproteobacteria bacterium]MBU0792390.1 RNA polymerase sigma factor [Alphaproteobacteria bacterium]MBU0877155.1 RNA polymerase sigma factor [Alphaproteobacteria bacterium]MBU1770729.1 RNA polymerase sigma factor [Alphaproteobacteria bacterium]